MKEVLQLQSVGFPASLTYRRQADALFAVNEVTAAWGLSLSEADVRAILLSRAESLRDSARVEFGEGIAAKLVLAFADSPYITQSNYADTIAALLVLFDTFKNELRDAYNDRELLTFMRDAFDGECAGALDILQSEVFPRLLTEHTSEGYRTAEDARYASDTPATVSTAELTRKRIRRQHTLEDQEADGRVYDTLPEVWEDENGRQV